MAASRNLVKPPTSEQLIDLAKSFKWYWLEYNRFPSVAKSDAATDVS
jgi:hypothetical protein